MKKKILLLLITAILLIPTFVFADVRPVHIYYNRNVIAGGEVEVNMPLNYDIDYTITIKYDTSLLSITEDMITISPKTSVRLENGDRKSVENQREVTIKDGEITLNTKMLANQGVIDDDTIATVTYRFTALKEGNTEISFSSRKFLGPVTARVAIDNLSTDCIEPVVEKPAETKPDEKKEDEDTTTTEEVHETVIDAIACKECEKCSDNSILIFGLIGACALLFILLIITIIVIIIKGKGKKEAVKNPEPVNNEPTSEENKTE